MTDSPDDTCPVDGCDYGEGKSIDFDSYAGHIKAKGDSKHNYGELKASVAEQTGRDDLLEGANDDPPEEDRDEANEAGEQEIEDEEDEYEQQWTVDEEDGGTDVDDQEGSKETDEQDIKADDGQSGSLSLGDLPVSRSTVIYGGTALVVLLLLVYVLRNRDGGRDGASAEQAVEEDVEDEQADDGVERVEEMDGGLV